MASSSSGHHRRFNPDKAMGSDNALQKKMRLRQALLDSLALPPKERREEDLERIVEYLGTCSFFTKLSSEIRFAVAREVTFKTAEKGITVISSAGMGTTSLYVIMRGSVSMQSSDGAGNGKVLSILDQGESFGEVSEVRSLPPHCSVIPLQETDLVVIPRQTYQKYLQFLVEKESEERVVFLRELIVQVFRSCSHEELHLVATNLHSRSVQANKVILRQGDEGDTLYFLASGECRVLQNVTFSPDTPQERQKILEVATLTVGEYFGELAVLDSTPRAVSIVSNTPVRLYCLNRVDFYNCCKDSVIEDFRRYAATYPSMEQVANSFLQMQRWNRQKRQVVLEALGANRPSY